MYNKILEEGEIPKNWKHPTITPKDVRSYRPIVLINILCKIFERMKNKGLVWYLEKEKKIDNIQFGFRKKSTTD